MLFQRRKKNEIKELEATHTQARDIRSFINRKYDAHHNMDQVYNETAKIRRERLGGLSPMRWTLIEADRLGYFIGVDFDDDHCVTRLFLCHPESIKMLSAWYFVILIDSTYKTNKYKQPLVQLIGVSPVKKNFNIGFALVSDETKETYAWVLSQLKNVLGGRRPDAFVTDKEGGLGVSVREIFPSSAHLLCVWHMKKNIEAKMISLGSSRESAEAFVAGHWQTLMNANTQRGFQQRWVDLQNSEWGRNLRFMNYLKGEWIPCAQRWAHCYTNRVFHIGNTSTNRVESAHSSLKKWLASSTHKIDTLFLRYHTSIEGKVTELRKDLEDSRLKVFSIFLQWC
ncbi:unnamed protein product [Linum tenue]|uniref:MULE transposase domain-containing protein n=2 Tax=Linum tenue TaxID=586396 RepID=A0AAV0NYJ2_9ROSI|nr:unnamed protein product [Linum tenue]